MNRDAFSGDLSNKLPENPLATLNDEQLLQLVVNENDKAFSVLYYRYEIRIYNYILRLIHDPNGAEDVLQEVFIAIWKGASSFRGQACVKTWIYRIAYKRAISWVRSHRFIFRYEEKDLPAEIIEYDEISMDHWRYSQMIDALSQLSIKHRAVLELAYTHGLSYREIAAVLECPIGTVKSRMCYALRSLSGKIKGMG